MPTVGWFEALVADAPRHVRVFHPEDVHMTVAFLGGCGEESANRAWAIAVEPALSQQQECPIRGTFQITLDALTPMGNPRRPSALSATLSAGVEEAVAIMRALRDPMIVAAGAQPAARMPLPHITVARPGRRCGALERKAAIAWAKEKPPIGATLTIDTLMLYTWSEDRRTRQFRAVASRQL